MVHYSSKKQLVVFAKSSVWHSFTLVYQKNSRFLCLELFEGRKAKNKTPIGWKLMFHILIIENIFNWTNWYQSHTFIRTKDCFSWQQWNFIYNIHQSAVCLLFQGSAIQSGPIHRPSVPTISEVGTLSQSGELPNNLASHMPAPDSITTKKYWFLITTYILLNMILEKSILVQVGWVLF